ncbi:MAG: dolichyl-phosphate beta-glucosyltransferase [Patescibacteria group bacterium]
MSKIYLSVVIPSYNEDKNFKRGVLDEVLAYLKKQDYTWELILSDDGSKKSFVEKLENFANKNKHVKLLKNIHAGKSAAVKSGILAANGDWRLFTDFDQSTPLSEIEKLFRYANNSYDVIIGSREMIGSKRAKEPWYRHLMGRVFNLVVQTLTIPGILDTQCGFKLFSREAAEKLFSSLVVYGDQGERSNAFTGAFDVEALYLAKKFAYKIREVPIIWKHYETDRVNPIKDSVLMFFDILKIRLAEMRGLYKQA